MPVPLLMLYEPVNGESRMHEHPALKLTDAERDAGVTPVSYAYPPAPIADARRYGFDSAADSATNKTALTNAFAALGATGGAVLLPSGAFVCDEIIVPEACWLRGAGMYSTRITYAGNGTFASVGSATNTGVLKGPCGISDCALYLTHKDGEGIRLRETKGSIVARMYIEGTQTAARTNRLVVIDGGNISSFFNHIDDVICNHGESCFVILTSGSQRATCQYFTNCSAVGDVGSVGAASKGLSIISSGGGDGSVWIGGNFETCGTGIHCDATALGFTVVGARFELNTKDIVLTAGCKPSFFYGLSTDTAYNVTDTNLIGGFYGCATLAGARWGATGTFTGTLTGMTATVAGTVQWRQIGISEVEIYLQTNINGTSNSTAMKMTGLPSKLWPGATRAITCGFVTDSGNNIDATAEVQSTGDIVLYAHTVAGALVRPSSTGFTNAGTKGLLAGWAVRFGTD